MEKNARTHVHQSVSRTVAREIENVDFINATEYLTPPPLFITAEAKNVKAKKDPEEVAETENVVTKSLESTFNNSESKQFSLESNISDVKVQKAIKPKEEPEEEIKEPANIELLFSDDKPELPNDDGDENSGAAGDAGNNDEGNIIQKTEGSSNATVQSPTNSNIPEDVLSKMESTLESDFSDVAVHTNSDSALNVNALAYTQGSDIHFAPGQYNPNTKSGQELLGHELAHVVQQREGRVQPTKAVNGMPVNDNQGLEKEADMLGAKAASSNSNVQLKKNVDNPKKLLPSAQLMQRKIIQLKTVIQRTAAESQQIQNLINRGSRNENYLTNVIFYIRHPDRDGDRLEFPSQEPQELANISEWITIRNTIVRPLLTPHPVTATPIADATDAPPSDQGSAPATNSPAPIPAPAPTPAPSPAIAPNAANTPASATTTPSGTNTSRTGQTNWDQFWAENGLNVARTVLEPFRLIPMYGLIPGFAADIMETVSDVQAAEPTHDEFIIFLIGMRAPIVIANNVVGHLLYVDELAQDIATGSVVGVELDILTAPTAEALASLKLGIQTAQTVIDAMIVAKSIMGMNSIESTPAERAAYRQVFFGYDANLIMDGIEFLTTGLDMASAGFANGTAIGQFVRVGKRVFERKTLFLRLVQTVVQSWVGVWGGNIESGIDSAVNGPPAQGKFDNENGPLQMETGGVEGISREIAANLILAELNQIEGAYSAGTTIIDATANHLQYVLENINELSQRLTDQDAIPAMKDAMLAGLDMMVAKLNGIRQTQPFITSAVEKSALVRGFLDVAEEKINSIQIPEIEVPDIPLVPGFLEDAAQSGMNLLIDNLNTAINNLKNTGIAAISALRDKSDEIGEFLHILSGVLESQIVFITQKIEEFRSMISGINSLDDIGNIMLSEISSMLGLDPPLTVERLREGWAELNTSIQGGFELARNMVEQNVRSNPAQGKFNELTIQKQDAVPPNEEKPNNNREEDIMQKMEASFGTSFSDVNFHTNSTSATENGALAYAQGTDVHFAPGQFKPETKPGQELIGHELAHVVQQKQGRVKPTSQLQSGLSVNTDQTLETEADQKGSQAANVTMPIQKKVDKSSVSQFKKPVTAGLKGSEEGIEVSLTVKPEKKIKAAYVDIDFSTPIIAKGELKLKGEEAKKGASLEQDSDGNTTVKTRLSVFQETAIKEGSTELSNLALKKLKEEGSFDIVSADLEGGLTLSEENGESGISPSTGVVLKLRNGNKITTAINLFKFATDESSGPKLSSEYEFNIASTKVWENNSAVLNAAIDAKFVVELTPNWAKIISELLKAEARAAIRQLLTRAVLGPGGFIAGLAVFIFCVYKSIESISSIKDARKKAEKAKDSYVTAFLTELGVYELGSMSGQDVDYVQKGANDGNKAIAARVTAIQEHEVFKAFNFTRPELFAAIRAKCKNHELEIYNTVNAQAKAMLYPSFVNAYYNMRYDEFTTPEYMAFQDAKWVGIGLGLSGDGREIKRKNVEETAQGKFKTSTIQNKNFPNSIESTEFKETDNYTNISSESRNPLQKKNAPFKLTLPSQNPDDAGSVASGSSSKIKQNQAPFQLKTNTISPKELGKQSFKLFSVANPIQESNAGIQRKIDRAFTLNDGYGFNNSPNSDQRQIKPFQLKNLAIAV